MEKLTIEKQLKKYPYLQRMSNCTLFTTKEDIDFIKNSKIIMVDGIEVYAEFLKRILENDKFFEYACRYFYDATDKFIVASIINGDLGVNIRYDKTTIINGIKELINTNQISLNTEEKERFEKLRSYISYDKFLEKYKNYEYKVLIDGVNYSIPFENMMNLMRLDDDKFNEICHDDNIKDINGVPKEYLIYATCKFLRENNIIDNYELPDNFVKRHNSLYSMQVIDLEAINKYVVTTDVKYKEIKIDSDLEKVIMDGFPYDASELEMAIYIYIKMCKVLTYDEEYYAVNQMGVATEKHRSTSHIALITPQNNQVVCFEFNIIYAKFLNMLGINFASNYKYSVGEAYGDGHANLDFRCGKFLVNADSVTSILQGDIANAKINQPLIGINCLNRNLKTMTEFVNAYQKMYMLVASQEKDKASDDILHKETFEELLSEYASRTTNLKDVSLEERLSILIDKVNKKGMVGIDSISYALHLRKILFNEEERKNKVKIIIIRNNEPFDKDKVAMPSVIVALNKVGFKNMPDKTVYFYYNPNRELVVVTSEELQSKFDEGIFEYVANDDPRIPGIKGRS